MAGALAGLTLLVILAAQPPSALAAADADGGFAVDASPASVREYWTPERMRRARSADRLVRGLEPATRPADTGGGEPGVVVPTVPRVPATGSGIAPRALAAPQPEQLATDRSSAATSFPERTHGKVYMTISGGLEPGDYQCSGTAVRSPSHTLVFTAGHCVFDSQFGGGAATNWIFVPGFDEGRRPFGNWTARRLYTTAGWQDSADARFDAGAAVLARDREGRGVQDVVGARGIAFNQPRDQVYTAFGYPAESPFNGGRLYSCTSAYMGDDTTFGSPRPMRIRCDMTAGASGGGWVAGEGIVASLTSYAYECVGVILPCGNPEKGNLFGPYFGGAIQDLYRRARGSAFRCGGREVTNLGYDGADRYSGTARDESFKLRGGGDQAAGGGGRDSACGGDGGDRLEGGAGRDDLRGGPGKDTLVGGPGRDVCRGGRGRDRAFGCEVRRKIRR
jgi:hypothetical protein